MIIKVVGLNKFNYEKDGKSHTVFELHFLRKPFESESSFTGYVTGTKRFFDSRADIVASAVPNKSYNMIEEQTGVWNGLPRYEVVKFEEVKETDK